MAACDRMGPQMSSPAMAGSLFCAEHLFMQAYISILLGTKPKLLTGSAVMHQWVMPWLHYRLKKGITAEAIDLAQ